MSNEKVMIIHLIVGLIKIYRYIKINYLSPYSYSKNKIEVELDLFNFETKSYLKNATGENTS